MPFSMMPIISDLRCANTATWHVFANFQGDGVSNKAEDRAQRPCCQELHVSSITLNLGVSLCTASLL